MAEDFPKRLVIVQRQMEQLRALMNAVVPANPFYTEKIELAESPRKFSDLGQFSDRMPFTTKAELMEDQKQNPPFGTNLTFPMDQYVRCHQTSGTTGTPMRWLDTKESWDWMVGNWEAILATAGVTREDRLFFGFSFGPFIAFWLAYEASVRMGCLSLSGGGLGTAARLRLILDYGVTVVCCTPTYAIRMAEVAQEEKLNLEESAVRLLVVAGEPGGSIPSTRQRIEEMWPNARVYDHHGMTEVGPVTYECPEKPGVLHVLESSYIAEIVDPATGQAVETGEAGELILTPLGRIGTPLLRYRTGDLVRSALDSKCECGRSDLALEGGILGRTDDMVVIRGVNVFPSAVEDVIRGAGGVAEYQVNVSRAHALAEMTLKVEPEPGKDPAEVTRTLEQALYNAFSMRVPVSVVSAGALPRFELKARRWVME